MYGDRKEDYGRVLRTLIQSDGQQPNGVLLVGENLPHNLFLLGLDGQPTAEGLVDLLQYVVLNEAANGDLLPNRIEDVGSNPRVEWVRPPTSVDELLSLLNEEGLISHLGDLTGEPIAPIVLDA